MSNAAVAQQPLISIVDDDDSLRASLIGLVRSLGYRASGFESAEAFLAGDDGGRSACVITDIHMPGLSGIELKQRLVKDGNGVPVIMITARTERDLHERAVASGALCVLQKPFAADDLIECLDEALTGRGPAR